MGKKDQPDRIHFAEESEETTAAPFSTPAPWKILVVDDEEGVHEITRLTLRDYVFENRRLELLHAYSASEARRIIENNFDVALILLDVVMEENDSGLRLVDYIRNRLGNQAVRIVLRTGQPGVAPEQEVIARYDINGYKSKPEITAQKLFTSITSCLRAYNNIRIIENNKNRLEKIVKSLGSIYENQSVDSFALNVLSNFIRIFKFEDDSEISSLYAMTFNSEEPFVLAGTGRYESVAGMLYTEILPGHVIEHVTAMYETGGEVFLEDEYICVFKTREGFVSILYLRANGFRHRVDKNLVRIYVSNVSIGFDNLALAREIVNTQKEVILTLGEVVETRSKETANHVTRVAEICYLMALKYGIEPEQAEVFKLAAPMHDIGKIGVAESVLNKPGKLTEDEFELVKKHSRLGYDILKNSNRRIMKTAALVALQHHERWDGTGYPQGLSGEDIHIFGRIAALADVFDALSHKRCYKEKWPLEDVYEFFESQIGKHFDPELTRIFLSCFDEISDVNRRFPD